MVWGAGLIMIAASWSCKPAHKESVQGHVAASVTDVAETEEEALPVLQPKINAEKPYWMPGDEKTAASWERIIELMHSTGTDDDMSHDDLPAADKLLIDSLENGYGPQTEPMGCSWYCGAQMDTVYATSSLPNSRKHTYDAGNLHDFWLLTPWAVAGDVAIGQRITFEFAPRSPRVNTIKIWNGYVRTRRQWEANSRVKEMKLLIDGRPKAILALADVAQEQQFGIEPVRSDDSLRPLHLQLEVTKVYAGKKSKDVVISEINFDGLDVHCFGGDTQVLMYGGSTKAIRSVHEGDMVMSYDQRRQQFVSTRVKRVIAVEHDSVCRIDFDEIESLILTADHPLYVSGKGWCSLNLEKSNSLYAQDEPVMQLKADDLLLRPVVGDSVRLRKVTEIAHPILTYTLELERGDNFVVNGFWTKTEVVKK